MELSRKQKAEQKRKAITTDIFDVLISAWEKHPEISSSHERLKTAIAAADEHINSLGIKTPRDKSLIFSAAMEAKRLMESIIQEMVEKSKLAQQQKGSA